MDRGLLRIILAGWGLLVKMFITLEPHHIFSSNLAYLFIFETDRENDKEKKTRHAWIQTSVHQAV